MSSGAHFVLVHGAYHGAWCWYKIRCLLECAGHKVSCLDLRASGIDLSDANTVFKFHEYNQPLDDVLSGLGEGEKVILVGHSAGGLNLTAALYKYPHKIQVAVYVVAEMIRDTPQVPSDLPVDKNVFDVYYGEGPDKPPTSLIYKKELVQHHYYQRSPLEVPDFISNDKIFDYHFGEGFDKPPTSIMVKKDAGRKYFYQRSPLEDSTLAGMLLKPQPVRALMDAKFGDDDVKIDDVPRVYIKTLDDNLMPSDRQDDMIEQWPPSDLYTIDSDHSAFFSNPLELFGLLLKVAAKYGVPN